MVEQQRGSESRAQLHILPVGCLRASPSEIADFEPLPHLAAEHTKLGSLHSNSATENRQCPYGARECAENDCGGSNCSSTSVGSRCE